MKKLGFAGNWKMMARVFSLSQVIFPTVVMVVMIVLFGGFGQTVQGQNVSFCGKVPVIGATLAKRLGLFTEFQGFQQASLVQNPDQSVTMEILYKPDEFIKIEKVPYGADWEKRVCSKIDSLTSIVKKPGTDYESDGRWALISSSLKFSLGYYGYAFPISFGWEDGKAYTASYLLMGGAGFFVPFFATRHGNFTRGMAKGYAMGGDLGIAHGFLLALALQGEDLSENMAFGLSASLSLGESLGWLANARQNHFSYGKMGLIGNLGGWGAGHGMALTAFLPDPDVQTMAILGLAGSGAGIYLGNYFSNQMNLAEGDVSVVNCLGALGTLLPAVIFMSYEPGSREVAATGLIAGSLGGLTLGLRKARDFDYSRTEGRLISFGEIGGSLAGLGIGYLADADEKTLGWTTFFGALGGFLLTDKLVNADRITDAGNNIGSLQFQFNPVPLFMKNSPVGEPRFHEAFIRTHSVVGLRYSF